MQFFHKNYYYRQIFTGTIACNHAKNNIDINYKNNLDSSFFFKANNSLNGYSYSVFIDIFNKA